MTKKASIKIAKVQEPTKEILNYYLYVVDRSGSMGGVREVTLSGLNEQIQKIQDLAAKNPDQKYYGTIILFNDEVNISVRNTSAEKLNELKLEDYVPRGMTALFDAVHEGIEAMREDAGGDLKDDSLNTTVSVVILTDGLENSSNKNNVFNVPHTIKELESTNKWVFSYVGANHDVKIAAESMNIKGSNAIAYSGSNVGTSEAFARMSRGTERYAMRKMACVDTSMSYFDATDENRALGIDIEEDVDIKENTKKDED